MSWFESIVLGILQGLTEFLPISSSGHLVVAEGAFAAMSRRMTSGSQALFFNVMLHLGTLAAILAYYREPILQIVGSTMKPASPTGPFSRGQIVRVGSLALVATLPAVVVGLTLKDQVERAMVSPLVAGCGFLLTAAILVVTPWFSNGSKGPAETTWIDALWIGIAQAIAITPGISRSGLTIVAALALGLSRVWAVSFSLVMAVLAILGAGVLELKDLNPTSLQNERWLQVLAGTALAGVVGYVAIVWLFRIVRGNRLWYFSVYLVLLAGIVFMNNSIEGSADVEPSRSSPMDTRIRDDRPTTATVGGLESASVLLDPAVRVGP